jgi:hypothetical protein
LSANGYDRWEAAARWLWRLWGEWGRHTVCHGCGAVRYCMAQRRRGPWLCVDCFDISDTADWLAEQEAHR